MEEKINELINVRKLATIAKIEEIKEIPEATNIQHARVRGWWVVVRRDEFKVGDLCIYAEVDSVFPDGLTLEKALEWKALQKELSRAATDSDKITIKEHMEEISKLNTIPEFEFLRGSKFRIRTKRIFGEISQGICFPLSILAQTSNFYELWIQEVGDALFLHKDSVKEDIESISLLLEEDVDVTELLGVIQYIPPDPAIMGGDAKGDMQNVGLLISDEERIENLSGKYEILKQFKYYKTEKLDGTSFTAYIKNGVFGVTGRTIEFKVPEPDVPVDKLNVYWKMAKKLNLENKMRNLNVIYSGNDVIHSLNNFALQGELVGEGIQSNIYKLKGQTVLFYNAFMIDTQEYMEYERFLQLLELLKLQSVPILDRNYELPENAIDLLLEADKTTTVFGNNPKQLIEGFVYVAKGPIPQGTRITRANFGRLSFKAKSRTYDISKK